MTSPYAQAALDAEVQAVTDVTEGTRNDRLNVAAFNLGQLVPLHLDEDAVQTALYQAAIAAGLTQRETIATIYSGLTKGMAHPRDPARLNGLGPVDEPTVIDTE